MTAIAAAAAVIVASKVDKKSLSFSFCFYHSRDAERVPSGAAFSIKVYHEMLMSVVLDYTVVR